MTREKYLYAMFSNPFNYWHNLPEVNSYECFNGNYWYILEQKHCEVEEFMRIPYEIFTEPYYGELKE